MNEQDTSEFLKVLVAADVLCLQELIDYLQKYLIESKSEWMEEHFVIIQQISSQSNNLLKLQQFCEILLLNFLRQYSSQLISLHFQINI